MNGWTQTTESGEASLAPAEENRWLVELPLTRVDDFREDRSKGWALGVQVDADNISSFAVQRAWIVPPSGPVALATEHAWTKTGQADPVLRAPADGPVMSVRVGVTLILHSPSGDVPVGLNVQLLLIEEPDED